MWFERWKLKVKNHKYKIKKKEGLFAPTWIHNKTGQIASGYFQGVTLAYDANPYCIHPTDDQSIFV